LERFGPEEMTGRASLTPGLFYRFRFGADLEFVCIDTSKEEFFGRQRLFEYPDHWAFVERTFKDGPGPRWHIPFCHHPRYCAGPRHRNTDGMERLDALFARAGVRVMFAGHEHNFQHSAANGIDYLLTGAGSKVRSDAPDRFEEARTVSWSSAAHFLLVTVDGGSMHVRPFGELVDGKLREIERYKPDGTVIAEPIVIQR
jgi:hypothetical protein